MAIIQLHHITYNPPWAINLSMAMHKTISYIQNTKATEEQYALLINFQHALSFECNRMRMELDTRQDLRVRRQRKNAKKS